MKAQLTQEAKDEIIKALEEELEYNWEQFPNYEDWIKRAIFCIESFPVSDGWKPNPTDNWIPVSDEMNLENHEHVFVYKTGWKKPIPAIFIKMDKREDRFRSADAGWTLLEPTHYMKVPNPHTSNK